MSKLANVLGDVLSQTTTTPPPSSGGDGLIYVIGAYAAIWLLIFGYIYYIQRKQAALKRDIELLRDEEQAELNRTTNVASPEEAAFKAGRQQDRG
jgi:CcmD family protein